VSSATWLTVTVALSLSVSRSLTHTPTHGSGLACVLMLCLKEGRRGTAPDHEMVHDSRTFVALSHRKVVALSHTAYAPSHTHSLTNHTRHVKGFSTPPATNMLLPGRSRASPSSALTSLRPFVMVSHGEEAKRESRMQAQRPAVTFASQNRRQMLKTLPALAVTGAAASLARPAAAEVTAGDTEILDGRWWVFPLAPYQRKKTVRTEAIAGQVWTFDQILGALYVHVPLRMTIVKLSPRGLLAFCPVNPTPECLALVRELEDEHGPLKYIVLGSAAIEHKVAAGPFAREFASAQLWVAPDQYSFPFDFDNVARGPSGLGRLDLTQLFFGLKVHALPRSSEEGEVPWSEDVTHLVLGPLKSRGGQVVCLRISGCAALGARR